MRGSLLKVHAEGQLEFAGACPPESTWRIDEGVAVKMLADR